MEGDGLIPISHCSPLQKGYNSNRLDILYNSLYRMGWKGKGGEINKSYV